MPSRLRRLAPVAACLMIAACAAHAPAPIAESDARGIDLEARRVFVRIQSNLERVAAQRPRHVVPAPAHGDALEAVVDAYAAYLADDPATMDRALQQVAAAAATRRAARSVGPSEFERHEAALQAAYFAAIDTAAASPQPLLRLVAGLRYADSVLLLEAAPEYTVYLDAHLIGSHGPAQSEADPLSEAWLRLPCRTLRGRAAAFTALRDGAKPLGGPLLACARDDSDWSAIEAALAVPQNWPVHAAAPAPAAPTPPREDAPAPPWDAATAIEFMAQDPDAAERALETAATDGTGKLDYALFLHAFRPQTPARDAKIATLLKSVLDAAADDEGHYPGGVEGADSAYDGSDASLAPKIVVASENELAQTQSAFYAIPCAVLLARPGLLSALEARYYSNRDNFIPRSGCEWGRGRVRGFPETELDAFSAAAAEADGYFIETFEGTMKYGFLAARAQAKQTLELDPRGLLSRPEPALDFPYQTWGLLGLGNQRTSVALKVQYDAVLAKIAAFYVQRGLTPEESRRAAKTGLFALLLGPECGGAVPANSPRATLLAGGVPEDLAQRAPDDTTHDAPATEACAEFAGMDPLLHVAVASPRALEALLARGADPDLRDGIGKTPLMVAAQHDRLDSAALLLAHRASVDATTYVKPAPFSFALAHDARTPLMYAAASGSLAMIRRLLDAGADPYRTDTKGHRAFDYLLGFGPVAPNAKLSAAERAEAARLLF